MTRERLPPRRYAETRTVTWRDKPIAVSRALQFGDDLASIRRGIGRLPDGDPSSVAGAIIDAALELAEVSA